LKIFSWLGDAISKKYFDKISCEVAKGETKYEMKKLSKEFGMMVLKESVKMRERSRKEKSCVRDISAIRNEFGGHKVLKKWTTIILK